MKWVNPSQITNYQNSAKIKENCNSPAGVGRPGLRVSKEQSETIIKNSMDDCSKKMLKTKMLSKES